jgi:hypothetical protein
METVKNTVPTQHAAVTSSAKGVEEYRVTFAFPRVTIHSSHLARCCSHDRTIEGYIRGTGMSKKAVFKKQLYERVSKEQSYESVVS